MVVLINVDAFVFLVFSNVICYLEDTGIGVSGNTGLCGSKETKRLHQQVKILGVVLVPYDTWKCAPPVISGGVNIPEVPGCHLLQQTKPL